jgi:ArsR family transcriptional regulator
MSPRTASHLESADLCDVRLVNQQNVEQTRRDMKPAESVMLLAETFRTLGDPNRLRIVWALSRAELCVCDLAAALGMSQSAVSHSLRALRQLRLVRYRRENRTAFYRLDDDHITHLVADGFEHVDERL